jgi:hypothetical protein
MVGCQLITRRSLPAVSEYPQVEVRWLAVLAFLCRARQQLLISPGLLRFSSAAKLAAARRGVKLSGDIDLFARQRADRGDRSKR